MMMVDLEFGFPPSMNSPKTSSNYCSLNPPDKSSLKIRRSRTHKNLLNDYGRKLLLWGGSEAGIFVVEMFDHNCRRCRMPIQRSSEKLLAFSPEDGWRKGFLAESFSFLTASIVLRFASLTEMVVLSVSFIEFIIGKLMYYASTILLQ